MNLSYTAGSAYEANASHSHSNMLEMDVFALTEDELFEISGAGVVSGAASGAVVGSITGGVSAAMTGGSVVGGMVTGAVTGAISGGISGYTSS